MDRFEVFEHSLPFYLMDVSGYVMHIKEAMHDSHPGIDLQRIPSVSLQALQTEF